MSALNYRPLCHMSFRCHHTHTLILDSNEFKRVDSRHILSWSSPYSFFFFFIQLFFFGSPSPWSRGERERVRHTVFQMCRGERREQDQWVDATPTSIREPLMSLATRTLSSIHCRGLISFTTNLKKKFSNKTKNAKKSSENVTLNNQTEDGNIHKILHEIETHEPKNAANIFTER